MRHHLVAFVAVPYALYALIWWTATWTFGRRLPAPKVNRYVAIGYGVAWLLYSVVLRNLPWAPFSWF